MFFEEFDEFDLALGLYHWLQHHWIGMDSKYEAYCKLMKIYKPSHSEEFFENIDDMAKLAYESFTDRNYESALDRVLNYQPQD